MIESIIATSDWHIRPLKRHSEYLEQFEKLITEVSNIKPDRVVIAGDLFHSKITVSNEMSQIIAKVLRRLAEYSKIIIIPGNHDAIINSLRVDSISPIIEMIDNSNIVYYKNSGVFIDKWDTETVWCVWSCLENQAAPDIKKFKEENPTQPEKTSYIALYHGVINGSTTDIGFSFTDEGVDVKEFFETDIFIAGDIHKHQTYRYPNYKNEGFGVMIGSLMQQDFGESPDKHGFVLLKNNDTNWSYELKEIESDYGFFTIILNGTDEIEKM